MNLAIYKKEAKEMIELGLPIVVSQLGIVAMGVADTIQVGGIAGKSAVSVAASGLSNSLSFTIAIIGILTLGVVAPMISKAEAEKNGKMIGLLFKATKRVALQLALATFVLCLILGFFLSKIGQEQEVVALAQPYNIVIAASMIPLFIFVALRQLSDGLGRTQIAMTVTITALAMNILLNWLFIYGIGFFPRLELLGAGIATLLSRIFMAVMLWWVISKEPLFKPYLADKTDEFKHLINKIFKVGLPSGLQGFFEVAVFAAAVVVIGWYGKYQQASHQIAINMCSVTYMMITGLASAGGIRVGHYWGLHDRKQILVAGNTALGISAVFMFFCAGIFFIFHDFLISLYTTDTNVVPIATTLLIIGGFFQISDGLQATALGILRGIAEVNIPTAITLFAYWVVGLPTGYMLAQYYHLNAAGVWLGLTAGLTVSAILLCGRFYAMVKKIDV
jgi:multidrug resistance protein, MATE family